MKKLFISISISIAIACVLAILTSCSEDTPSYKHPHFPKSREMRIKVINDSDISIFAKSILEYNQYLVVLDRNPMKGNNVHVFDKSSGKNIIDLFPMGRGPGEAASAWELWREGDTFFLFDMAQNKVSRFNLDSLMMYGPINSVTASKMETPPFLSRVFLSDTLQIAVCCKAAADHDESRDVRLSLHSTNLNCTYNEFPVEKKEDKFLLYRDQPVITVSPDKAKMAIGSAYGAILEIFDIEGGFNPASVRYFIEPDYLSKDGELRGFNENTVTCFTDAWSSDSHIYTTYDETPLLSRVFKAPTNIAVFNWDGKPQELIKVNGGVKSFCVSEDESTIYAIVVDTEGQNYLARLE